MKKALINVNHLERLVSAAWEWLDAEIRPGSKQARWLQAAIDAAHKEMGEIEGRTKKVRERSRSRTAL